MSNPQAALNMFIATGVDCTCPRTNCIRHGKCDECRTFHASANRPGPPFCERQHKPVLLKHLFGN